MPHIQLAHGWILEALEPPAEAHAALAGPAAAAPAALAELLGPLRLYAVPYLGCRGERFFVSWESPEGENHSSVWLELEDGIHLFLAFAETSPHDAGFELLAALGELAVPRLDDQRFSVYARLLARELQEGATGEIDEESLEAKQSAGLDYPAVSLASTLAEYMHAMWHDVELRRGPEHLAPPLIRRRFELLAEWFPPNPGRLLFRE
jgi:hypothetical protein